MSRIVRVLVVDDSAWVRRQLTEMLARHPQIEVVGTAFHGRDALDRVVELHPDVVTLDLNMPELDGVGFLREQMRIRPLPVVVVSVVAEGDMLAADAVAAGAVEFVKKPTHLASDDLLALERELQAKVLTASRIPPWRLHEADGHQVLRRPSAGSGALDAVVLGLSTGGPRALRYLVGCLPADLPVGLAAVVHMPEGYTGPFAQSLDQLSELEVLEAREGLEMRPGRLILARAGRHLVLRDGQGEPVVAHLAEEPSSALHRPCVDELFRSASEVYGHRLLAIVLTGMGDDGTRGAAWVTAQGGLVLAEAEETCVVYGMPRSVVEAGLADEVVPLLGMPQAILDRL